MDLVALERSSALQTSKADKVAALIDLMNLSADNDMQDPIHLAPSTSNRPSESYAWGQRAASMFAEFCGRHIPNQFAAVSNLLTSGVRSTLAHGTDMPPPLNRAKCGNQVFETMTFCPNDTKQFCSKCKLVGYCSKACQVNHWQKHKQDCKNPKLSEDWKPAWVKERRQPSFVTGHDTGGWSGQTPYGAGSILWGNVPAHDILNLKRNEGYDNVKNQDISLAFVASGDLRNVIRTVNELPQDYDGTLNILLNDRNPFICSRNLAILLVLSQLADENEAAEHALFIWYSVFLPMSYIPRVLPKIQPLLLKVFEERNTTLNLTGRTILQTRLNTFTIQMMAATLGSRLQPADAQNGFSAVMNAPERVDYRHRYFCRLKPSHRVAFEEWRNFGLVLPFGAANAHMNLPNKWLFAPDGRLWLNDSASPLEGWDLDAVLEAGLRYGTQTEDIMGCLFFYVKEQLVNFIKRLRSFKINISFFDRDAVDLPSEISSMRFDRIEVSNIVDKNYLGLSTVLTKWGPLLNPENEHSALIGLFMNWVAYEKEGSADESVARNDGPLKKAADAWKKAGRKVRVAALDVYSPEIMCVMSSLNAFNENSKAFRNHLRKEKEETTSKLVGLEMRKVNKIVPHRPHATLGTSWDTLPDLDGEDRLYLYTSLSMVSHCERYVEWTRKAA